MESAGTGDVGGEGRHRHPTDHGGARVRTVLVESEGALEESYDVLVAGHRWPALTRALVADVHAHGRTVVGVHDREQWPQAFTCDFIFVTEDIAGRVEDVVVNLDTDASDHQPVLLRLNY